MMKKRVVVTGMGAVTPIGNNVEEFWSSIKAGKVGIGEITKFDTTDYKVKIAAEVKDFNPADFMDFKAAKRIEPFSQYARSPSVYYMYTFEPGKKSVVDVFVHLVDRVIQIHTYEVDLGADRLRLTH